MPEISVIVPVYRAEPYLRACVDSILSQTFSDFEIILVDDGSPDGCGAICEEYASREPRIRVMHQENQGQAAARNHALSVSKGQWICFVDSDDQIHPQMLELLYQAAQESGSGISMCRMLEAATLPSDFERCRATHFEVFTMDEKTLVSLYDQDQYPGWVACAKLIRREYVEGYPFQTGKVYEDNEAVCHWLLPAERIALVPEALYFYRTNVGSTTKSQFNIKRMDYLWALRRITAYFRSVGYEIMAQRFFERYIQAAEANCYGAHSDLQKPELAKRILSDTICFAFREKQKLTKEQWICMLDAAYPKQMESFWNAAEKMRKLLK